MGRRMRIPTDDELAQWICCGRKCEEGPNTGLCHRWDFVTEVAKVRALLTELQVVRDQAEEAHQV